MSQLSQSVHHGHNPNESIAAKTISIQYANQGVGTLDQLATFLSQGYWEAEGLSQRSYDLSSNNQITVNITNLNADGQQMARWAFEAWELVANMDFVESNSEEVMMVFDDEESGAYAVSSTSGLNIIASEVNVDKSWITEYGSTISSYAFSTYVHEIGHALGLGHQGAYNSVATYGENETFSNDSYQASIMSYFSQTDNTTINASYAEPVTAMMADILAIQSLYGAPGVSSQTEGDTIWGKNTNIVGYLADIFDGLGNTNTNLGNGPVTFTIYDRDGTDRIDFSASNDNNRLDMRGEAFSDIAGLTGNVAIARGTVIENATLGSGNDTVIGNDVANTIVGGQGADNIDAGAGDDFVWAGAGDQGNDTITGGLGHDVMGGAAGDDSIVGGEGNDAAFGGAGADTLDLGTGQDKGWAGEGNDQISAGDGDDIIGGGVGNDTLNGDLGNDIIYASSGADEVYGGGGDDFLYAGSDNDTLYGGEGNDQMFGGAGDDNYVFELGHGEDSIGGFLTNGVNTIDLRQISGSESYDLDASQEGADTLVTTGLGTILLWGTNVDDLEAANFLI